MYFLVVLEKKNTYQVCYYNIKTYTRYRKVFVITRLVFVKNDRGKLDQEKKNIFTCILANVFDEVNMFYCAVKANFKCTVRNMCCIFTNLIDVLIS